MRSQDQLGALPVRGPQGNPSLAPDDLPLAAYQRELNYLGRVPGWGTQALRMPFYESMEKLAEIEPLAMLFIQDQLRGSPLLFFSQALDGLSRDANRLAGVTHRLFGEEIGTGFNALNPGLARGVLHVDFGVISEDFSWPVVDGAPEYGTFQLEDLNQDGPCEVFEPATLSGSVWCRLGATVSGG